MFLEVTCLSITISDYLAYIISLVYFGLRVGIPILLIIVGMIDMAKAITAKKEDDVKKAQSLLVKKLLIGVIVFVLPYFIELLLKLLLNEDDTVNCIKALIDYRTNIFHM